VALLEDQAMIEQTHKTIWLQPWCDGCEKACYGSDGSDGSDGRQWCQDNVWDQCEECDNKSVKYVIATAPQALAATPAVDIPLHKAIERVIDDHSAWIARPNDEVTRSIAKMAIIAVHEIISEREALSATPAVGGEIEDADDLEFLDLEHLYGTASPQEQPAADPSSEQRAHLHDAERIPQHLSGCLHPGECQSRGMCQSMSCRNAGKVIVKRVCVEPKEAGIVYPKVES
jgi:hypothetical protein